MEGNGASRHTLSSQAVAAKRAWVSDLEAEVAVFADDAIWEAVGQSPRAAVDEIVARLRSAQRYTPQDLPELVLAANRILRPVLRDVDLPTRMALIRELEPFQIDDPLVRRMLSAGLGRPPDPEKPEGQPTRMVNYQTLMDSPPPPVGWLCDGLLPEDGLAILSGEGGIGKTLLALLLARSVISGNSFGGHAMRRTGGVTIVECEGGLPLLCQRLRALGITREEAARIELIRNDDKDMGDPVITHEGAAKLITAAKERGDVLIIMDPLRRMHTASENVAEEMAAVLAPISRASTGILTLLLHHDNKTKTQYRGSTVIRDEATVLLQLADESGTIRLRTSKLRIGQAPPPLVMTVLPQGLVSLGPDVSSPGNESVNPALMAMLDEIGRADGEWVTAARLAEVAKIGDRWARQLLDAVEDLETEGGHRGFPLRYRLRG